jgi:hypothetical protein
MPAASTAADHKGALVLAGQGDLVACSIHDAHASSAKVGDLTIDSHLKGAGVGKGERIRCNCCVHLEQREQHNGWQTSSYLEGGCLVAIAVALHLQALPADSALEAIVAVSVDKSVVCGHDWLWQHLCDVSIGNPAVKMTMPIKISR